MLIISYIASKIVKDPTFEIIPYPHENKNIFTENI